MAICIRHCNPRLHVGVTARAKATQAMHLKELVLEGHVILGLQTNTRTEDVRQGSTLLGESVDDRSASGGERSLY